MSQELLKSHLTTLERKISLLLGEYKATQKELKYLTLENTNLKEQIAAKDRQIDGFQNKIKISKIVKEIDTDGGDSPELKRKIDEYIKEIDKCIVHLSK